jgi:hypothetical protein
MLQMSSERQSETAMSATWHPNALSNPPVSCGTASVSLANLRCTCLWHWKIYMMSTGECFFDSRRLEPLAIIPHHNHPMQRCFLMLPVYIWIPNVFCMLKCAIFMIHALQCVAWPSLDWILHRTCQKHPAFNARIYVWNRTNGVVVTRNAHMQMKTHKIERKLCNTYIHSVILKQFMVQYIHFGLVHFFQVTRDSIWTGANQTASIKQYMVLTVPCPSHSSRFLHLWKHHQEVLPKSCLLAFPHPKPKRQTNTFEPQPFTSVVFLPAPAIHFGEAKTLFFGKLADSWCIGRAGKNPKYGL